MKINQIRLSNLNSLLGEWQIDLDHPMYSADGIFAITGPTGSGKSTILDAICLALYGRTPRLSKVNKSSNEVMSRQAGECFAEVTFETHAGRFVAHWSQHRSRKQARGDLQNPKHELSAAATKEILESKLSLVPRRVETETGMDFDRFTRSMLLAQGGFDTFLKADADDRAPILEQMTGTEIYSEISMNVHERNRNEADLLKQLKASESELSVLSSEQVALLRQAHKQNLLVTETLGKEIFELTNNKQVLLKITDLETRKLQQEKQSENLAQREIAFEAEAEKLDRALRALELDGSYQSLSAKRTEAKKLQQEQANTKLKLPQVELQLSQQEIDKSIALKNQSESSELLNIGLKLFQQVRKLDSDIELKQSAYGELSQTLQKTELEKKLVLDRSSVEADALTQAEAKLCELELWFEKNSIDAKLSDEIQLIFQRLDDAEQANEEYATAKLKDKDASKRLLEQKNKLTALRVELLSSTEKLSALAALKDQAISNFETALAGGSLQQLEAKALEVLSLQAPLGKAISCCQQLAELRQDSSLALAESDQLTELMNAQSNVVLTAQQIVAELEGTQALSQKALMLSAKIVELESLRSALKDDEACPLCGALAHPYVNSDNLQNDQPDQLEQELANIGTRLAAARVANEAAKLQQVKQQERHEALREMHRLNQLKAEKLNVEMKRDGLFEDEFNSAPVADQLAFFVAKKGENEQLSHLVSEKLLDLRQLQTKCDDAITKSDNYKDQVEGEAKKINEATHQVALLEKDQQISSDVVSGLKAKRDETFAIVEQSLAYYGCKDISLAEDRKRQLSARLKVWQDQDFSLKEVRTVIENLKVSLSHLKERLAALDEAKSATSEEKAALGVTLDSVKAERVALFSDYSVEIKEAKLRDDLKRCEAICQQNLLDLKALEQTLGQLKARLVELEELDSALVKLLQATETEFVDALKNQEFSDEAVFVEAMLSPTAREQLVQKQQILLDERKQLLVIAEKDAVELTLEMNKPIKLKVLLDVDEQLTARNQKQSEAQQEIGVITQKLEANEKQSEVARIQLQKIEIQAGVCEQWKMLHELIGSSDGKKFRNFAQGLSFELMVVHANQQLKKMTDRYLLQRDIKQPLALNVIDFYQDAEVRSTKNLSGGESFIVSLALALGLSNMSSRQIRVDSLFLDEGFGTLDEEALEIALDTLSALQQTGKLIGVISHVAALKDRISTQIHVEPKTGGKSVLVGPGVQRLA